MDTTTETTRPPLQGSEKQIDWALRIRDAKPGEIERWLKRPKLFEDLVIPRFDDALASLQAETWAGWWIDQRDVPALDLLGQRIRDGEMR